MRAVEVQVVVVGVVPVVVPHAHGYVDSIGLEQQVDIRNLLNPRVELAVAQTVDFVHKINQLDTGAVKFLGLGLECVGMAVVAVVVIPDVTVGVVQARGTVAAFPQVSVAGAEAVLTVLEIALVDGFHQFIDSVVGFLAVSLDVEPQPAIVVAHGRPHASPLEQVITEHLAHVGRIVLEPLEVQFAHVLDGVGIVIDILAQVHAEMGMVPVGVVALVHLSAPSLRAPA